MSKFTARLLILMIGFGSCGKSIYASTAFLRAETANRLNANDVVMTPLDRVSPALRETASAAKSTEVNGEVEGASSGQAAPTPGQNSPQRHSHRVRNMLIGVGAMCVLVVIIAATSLK